MKRYCTNCKKEFEFPPVAVSGREDLICPECGGVVGKNSRMPVDRSESDKFERQLGSFFQTLAGIAYIFYITLAIIGIVGYFLNLETVLYVATGISLVAFIVQLLTRSCSFRLGILFLPLGGAAGAYLLGGIKGACVGILSVFFIRHILRDVLFAFVSWLIHLGNR